jgi:hypothetical protein
VAARRPVRTATARKNGTVSQSSASAMVRAPKEDRKKKYKVIVARADAKRAGPLPQIVATPTTMTR